MVCRVEAEGSDRDDRRDPWSRRYSCGELLGPWKEASRGWQNRSPFRLAPRVSLGIRGAALQPLLRTDIGNGRRSRRCLCSDPAKPKHAALIPPPKMFRAADDSQRERRLRSAEVNASISGVATQNWEGGSASCRKRTWTKSASTMGSDPSRSASANRLCELCWPRPRLGPPGALMCTGQRQTIQVRCQGGPIERPIIAFRYDSARSTRNGHREPAPPGTRRARGRNLVPGCEGEGELPGAGPLPRDRFLRPDCSTAGFRSRVAAGSPRRSSLSEGPTATVIFPEAQPLVVVTSNPTSACGTLPDYTPKEAPSTECSHATPKGPRPRNQRQARNSPSLATPSCGGCRTNGCSSGGLRTDSGLSRRGESHPPALADPGVSLSAHRALVIRPSAAPLCQCAKRAGSRLWTLARIRLARGGRPRSRLYFFMAHRTR